MKIISALQFIACLVICGLVSAQSSEPSQMNLLNNERTLNIGDRLVYQVVEEREPEIVVFVNDRGNVELPLLGVVSAQGKSPQELAYEVKDQLEVDFFHEATVLMRFQYANNSRGKINLVGQVTRPGLLNIPADEVLTVSSAIIRSGGFRPGADTNNVIVKRSLDGSDEVEEITVNVNEVLEEGNMAADLVVRPDDVILVPKSNSSGGNIYITGAVNSPGEYQIPPNQESYMLSQAILRAGGFAKFANKKAVILLREVDEGESGQEKMVINVGAVLEEGKRENDVALKSNDIIRVEEVMFAF